MIFVELLSEDGDRTWKGLRALLLKLFNQFDEDGRTRRLGIKDRNEVMARATGGNEWRAKRSASDARQRDLWRYLARLLAEGTVVFFHYDGDTVWTDRAASQGTPLFEDRLQSKVRQVLLLQGYPGDQADELLTLLVPCVPFYSAEAWFLQATDEAIRLCALHHGGRHRKALEEWAKDRTLLDDVLTPKQANCLLDEHNDILAARVPVREVIAADRSLAAFNRRLAAIPRIAPLLLHQSPESGDS